VLLEPGRGGHHRLRWSAWWGGRCLRPEAAAWSGAPPMAMPGGPIRAGSIRMPRRLVHAHKLGHDVPAWRGFWCCATGWAGASARRSSFIPPRAWMRCRTEKRAKTPAWKPARRSSRTGWRRSLRTSARAGDLRRAVDHRRSGARSAQDARRQAPARRCSKRWSGAGQRACGRPRRWGAGATMSFWSLARAHAGDAGGSCADAGRPGPDGGLPLVGRPGIAHREHRRGAGGTRPNSGGSAGKGAKPPCSPAFMRAETRSRPRRGASMFAIIGIVVVFGSGHRRLSDGEGPHPGAASAGRVADHRRRGHGHAAGGQSDAHHQGIGPD
jgi:hypothetical protein